MRTQERTLPAVLSVCGTCKICPGEFRLQDLTRKPWPEHVMLPALANGAPSGHLGWWRLLAAAALGSLTPHDRTAKSVESKIFGNFIVRKHAETRGSGSPFLPPSPEARLQILSLAGPKFLENSRVQIPSSGLLGDEFRVRAEFWLQGSARPNVVFVSILSSRSNFVFEFCLLRILSSTSLQTIPSSSSSEL